MSEFERHLASARNGDEVAFTVLFRAAQPSLLRYLESLARDRSLVEEVAGETWVSVVKGLHRFKGDEAGWRAWVLTIGRARLHDAQRQIYRRPRSTDIDEQALSDLPAHDNVEESVQVLLSTEIVLASVKQLPADQAEIVVLRYIAGLDVARTARIVNKSPGAVRVAAHRGLRSLAELLAIQDHPDLDLPQ
ncbi:RNA polymerase sigma factor [Nocardioides allogilvus]|uniref:RNA polymerase sigma factor n=1 Tax=Nocardioides allogilvus TaxID=2072017 RepID=UPI001300AD25|nr:RNA polymerase sigma factor [Nocardioides allogilvus]